MPIPSSSLSSPQDRSESLPCFSHIIVLAGSPDPDLVDPNILLTHEFDRNDTLSNVTAVLEQYMAKSNWNQLKDKGPQVTVQRVILRDWPTILATLIELRATLAAAIPVSDLRTLPLLVFNLCDGSELDGYPGGTVPQSLEENRFVFTGSMASFYAITTPKTLLKTYLQHAHVPTSEFVYMNLATLDQDANSAHALLGSPVIVKPDVSYASLGITSTSVTRSPAETANQSRQILAEFPLAGCFVERFLPGREFTALVCGHYEMGTEGKGGVQVYPVAERVFREGLVAEERFLAFDRYWDGWTIEGDRPPADTPGYYKYEHAPMAWQQKLMQVALDAYVACHGTGYGRVDMRTMSTEKCDVFVLEVNANCGLTFDETSSLGEILRLSKVDPMRFLSDIIVQSLERASVMPNLGRDDSAREALAQSKQVAAPIQEI
ncbi:hypothetical protein BC828DRAFT_381627 [Blastocladiella britannica]|nr:hypothetical protein BC828DRAFT_381627 [Blastocladiella britannica]